MEKLNGWSNVQGARGHLPLLPKGLSGAVYGGSISSERRADMPSSSSTNFPTEPSWLEDLLNEPETPANRRHRRSISDPFAYIGENSGGEEVWRGNNTMGEPAWGFQTSKHFNDRAPFTRKLSAICEEKDNSCSSSSTTPLPFDSTSTKEPNRAMFAGSEMQNPGGGASNTVENSSGGSNGALMKPSVAQAAPKTEVKQKQHNARRSRARKLQYIAELERNVQALQVEGVAVSAQLEFLDQQNLILAMENRALKQRLENLSQEQLIKSLEQEILDRELGRLQYLYHVQNISPHQHPRPRQKQKAVANHRRGRSCDLDSQFSRLTLHPQESIRSKGSP